MFVPYYEFAERHSIFEHQVYGLEKLESDYYDVVDYKQLSHLTTQLRYLWELITNNSIVHFHNMLCGKRINFLLKHLPVSNIVFTEFGVVWNISSHEKGRVLENAESAKVVIVPSRAAKSMLQKKIGIPAGKMTVVYDGFIDEAKIPKEMNVGQEKVVGFIGRLEAFKGVQSVIDCARLLRHERNILFKIAGEGRFAPVLKDMASGLNNVQFVGRVKDPIKFIEGVDIVVIPSIREPLGGVVIEAGFSGRPVIASYIDGIPEIIQDNVSGILIKPKKDIPHHYRKYCPENVIDPDAQDLVPPKEIIPEELSVHIMDLLRDPEKMQLMADNLYAVVKKRFSLQSYFYVLESIYRKILQ